MPKNLYYDDVKIIKRPLKRKFKNILIIFLCACVFSLTCVCSFYLSKALSVGNIASAIAFGGKDIKISKHSYYMVTLGSYTDYDEAMKVSLGSNIQGAGGFIWEKDEKYYVVGSVYKNENDANSVKSNLQSTNYNIEIIPIDFPKVEINFDDFENKDVAKVRQVFEFIDKVIDSIYNYSIQFDKSEINNFAICSGLSEIRGDAKANISSMQNLLITKSASDLQKVINTLTKIDEILNDTMLKTLDNSTTNYTLKNSLSSICYQKYNLYKSL